MVSIQRFTVRHQRKSGNKNTYEWFLFKVLQFATKARVAKKTEVIGFIMHP